MLVHLVSKMVDLHFLLASHIDSHVTFEDHHRQVLEELIQDLLTFWRLVQKSMTVGTHNLHWKYYLLELNCILRWNKEFSEHVSVGNLELYSLLYLDDIAIIHYIFIGFAK